MAAGLVVTALAGVAAQQGSAPAASTGGGAVAHLRRRPGQHAVFGAGPDHGRELRHAAGGLALPHRPLRAAPGAAAADDAPLRRRRTLCLGGIASHGGQHRSRPPASCSGRGASTSGRARSRARCPGAAWPTGRAAPPSASSSSRPATSCWRSTPPPARSIRRSAPRASSTCGRSWATRSRTSRRRRSACTRRPSS